MQRICGCGRWPGTLHNEAFAELTLPERISRLILPIPATETPAPAVRPDGRVVLFGEVLADVFPDGPVLGGAPFNVARHLQAFGCAPVLLSRVGEDALGRRVLARMAGSGMLTQGMQLDTLHPTGQVRVHLADGRHRFEILDQQAYDFIDASVMQLVKPPQIPALIYFGTLAQRHAVSRQSLATLLCSTPAIKFLDVNLRAPWYDSRTLAFSMEVANIVKLNDQELLELADLFELSTSDPHGQADALMRRFQLAQLVVTCGAKGAWQMCSNSQVVEVGASPLDKAVIDTVGAGDGFAAVYLLGTRRHWPVALTLTRANAFAAAICGIRGAIPDDLDFYQPIVQEWES